MPVAAPGSSEAVRILINEFLQNLRSPLSKVRRLGSRSSGCDLSVLKTWPGRPQKSINPKNGAFPGVLINAFQLEHSIVRSENAAMPAFF